MGEKFPQQKQTGVCLLTRIHKGEPQILSPNRGVAPGLHKELQPANRKDKGAKQAFYQRDTQRPPAQEMPTKTSGMPSPPLWPKILRDSGANEMARKQSTQALPEGTSRSTDP
jgi:hypothetical protein